MLNEASVGVTITAKYKTTKYDKVGINAFTLIMHISVANVSIIFIVSFTKDRANSKYLSFLSIRTVSYTHLDVYKRQVNSKAL